MRQIEVFAFFLLLMSVSAHFDKIDWLQLDTNSYVSPTEIGIDKNYRITINNYQAVYFKFQKSLLEPNQKYNVYVAYPGVHSSAFHLFWVDFPEDFESKHFTSSNPKFRPLDAFKLYFLTDPKGYITNEKADLFLDSSGEAYYHFVLFTWHFMYAKDPDDMLKELDFVIGIKKTFSYAFYKHEVILYVVASVLVLVWFVLFLKKKFKLFNDLTTITYSPEEIPKRE